MFSGLDHLDIAVDDPERMADYLTGLGFEVLRRTGERGTIEIRFPGGPGQPFLELRSTKAPDGKVITAGLRHMALRTTDLEATYAALKSKGYAFKGSPKSIEDTGRTVVNLIDPDGNPLQIVSN